MNQLSLLRIIFFIGIFFIFDTIAFICPKTYQSIQVGDSAELVRVRCGKPKSITKQWVVLNDETQLDIWHYDAKNYADLRRNGRKVKVPEITFTLSEKKILSIQIAGTEIGAVSACGQQFETGQLARALILSKCGRPSYETTRTQLLPREGKVQASTWIYVWGNYAEPKRLKFYDGKLMRIE